MTSWLVRLGVLLHLWYPPKPCSSLVEGGRFPAVAQEEPGNRFLCSDGYAVLESDRSRDPLWSAEHLTKSALGELPYLPRMGTFDADARLPRTARSELPDYAHSGYDRGHMTPSGDMADPVEQQQSFLLSNVVPQTAALNRHAWEHIEAHVRAVVASYGEAYVVTGPVFEAAIPTTIGADHVWVPDETWKAIYVPSVGAAAWICTNTAAPVCRGMSVEMLAALVHVDPFPGLGAGARKAVGVFVVQRRSKM